MTDNKPPFFHSFYRLDIFRGLLFAPKNQTADRLEHYKTSLCLLLRCLSLLLLTSFPSLLSRTLGCCESLYLLKTRKMHTASLPPSVMLIKKPSLTVNWVMPVDPSCIIIFQNSRNMGQLTRMSNEISFNTVI